MTTPVPTPSSTALDLLHDLEADIRTLGALTRAIRMLGTGGDTLVPGEVVYEIGRLANNAAERVAISWHDAYVALREQ